jgi:aspartate racemase
MSAAPQRLGVLGGMGPLAGAAFALRMVQLMPADSDQEHIPVLLCNDPGDSRPLVGLPGPRAEPAARHAARHRDAGGRGRRLHRDSVQHRTPVVRANCRPPARRGCCTSSTSVVADLRRQGVTHGKVGILGTPATVAMGLYQRHLRAAGYEPIEPSPDDVQRLCVPAIAAVKANSHRRRIRARGRGHSPARAARRTGRGARVHRTAACRPGEAAPGIRCRSHRFN